jgi:hypothetical protein
VGGSKAGYAFKEDDMAFVGRGPGDGFAGDPEYADTTLWAFSSGTTDCTANCGSFVHNDDHGEGIIDEPMLLSRVVVPFATSGGALLAGAYGSGVYTDPHFVNARIFHARRHIDDGGGWSGVEQADEDGDGLTHEIEQTVGAGDRDDDTVSNVGVRGMTCLQFRNLINGYRCANDGICCGVPQDPRCWWPTDSDNDGIPDDWEVFGGVVNCEHDPEPPYYGVGECSIVPLRAALDVACDIGLCFADDISAHSNPDPRRHDIYLELAHTVCDGVGVCTTPQFSQMHQGPTLSHGLSQLQQDALTFTWTVDPGTCWDGTTALCPDPEDLRYQSAIHVYNGEARPFADCGPGKEIPGGAENAKAWYNHSFASSRKYTGTMHFGFAAHGNGGGQAKGPIFSFGNVYTSDPSAKGKVTYLMSHEFGHVLGLEHVHKRPTPPDADTECDFAAPCPSASASCNATGCPTFNNPVVPSLMDYRRTGALPKSDLLPPLGLCDPPNGCEPDWNRFSKGLLYPLDETALDEVLPVSDWHTVKLAQDLHCRSDPAAAKPGLQCSNRTCEDMRTIQECLTTAVPGACWFNWDNDWDVDATPYQADISYGRYDSIDACDEDILEDRNEWLHIVATGKDALNVVRYGRRLEARTHGDFYVYQDSFNDDAPANFAGWPFAVEATATIDEAVPGYAWNQCDASTASSCSTGTCKLDSCTTSANCRAGTPCVGGVCSCPTGNDGECWSQLCDGSTGTCSATVGACSCATGSDCPGGFGCQADGVCDAWRGATTQSLNSGFHPPFSSVEFEGPGSGDHVRLADPGAGSPIASLADTNRFTLDLEFRFDGFAPGQPEQVVLWCDALRVKIVLGSGGAPALSVSAGGGGALVFPDPLGRVGDPIEPGRWYQVEVTKVYAEGEDEHGLAVSLTVWDKFVGRYDAGLLAGGCVKTLNVSAVAPPGDVWLGWDGAGGSDRFVGRMDNVSLFNWAEDGSPDGCIEQ